MYFGHLGLLVWNIINMFSHVLVQWCSGQDAGLFSVLETTCVRGFDLLSFNSDGYIEGSNDTRVVVEWRAGKKPKIGWPIFEATLLRASGWFESFFVFHSYSLGQCRYCERYVNTAKSKAVPLFRRRIAYVTCKPTIQMHVELVNLVGIYLLPCHHLGRW